MKKLTTVTALLVAGGLLAACDMAPESDSADRDRDRADGVGDAVATVNGKPISDAELTVYAGRRGPDADRQTLIDDLISIELLAQAAIRDGLDRRTAVAGELASQRNAILAQAAVRERLENAEITEEAIAEEYERFSEEGLGEELNARHILVPDEQLARDLIEQLDAGADFGELAREHSQDGSAEQGGDLGWFDQESMVEPFGERAAALEPGEYTDEPVQTQFGWHVIRLEDRRNAAVPPLDEVRTEIRGYLQSQMVEGWVDGLREEAEVEILLDEDEDEEVAPANDQ